MPRAGGGPRPVSPLTLAAEAAAEAVYGATHGATGGGVPGGASTLPPGAGPSGGRHVLSHYKSQAVRVDAADSWYARNRSDDKATLKGQVESDIQNMLLSSREIAGRLRPEPVARKTTINFLATPKMPRGALDNYEGTDPAEWAYWKRQELAREAEAAAAKQARTERWTEQKREQMKRWKDDKDALEAAMREQAEALEKEKKRYARELGKYIKSKNAEEVDEFKSRREKQVRRAADMKSKKVGDFTPYHNEYLGPLEANDPFGKVSLLDTLPDIHKGRGGAEAADPEQPDLLDESGGGGGGGGGEGEEGEAPPEGGADADGEEGAPPPPEGGESLALPPAEPEGAGAAEAEAPPP